MIVVLENNGKQKNNERTFERDAISIFGETGAEWLQNLPNIIAHCEQQWELTVSVPFEDLSYNYVAPAICADGVQAILKIGVPNPELFSEIEALQVYNGRGCVRLLAADRSRGAMLLERLSPGKLLAKIADDEQATHIAAQVMRQLQQQAPSEHNFRIVGDWGDGFEHYRPPRQHSGR